MNRTELIKAVAVRSGETPAKVQAIIAALSDEITAAVRRSEPVQIHGLLRLKVENKPARTGRNPKTGEAIQIAAKNVVKITADKALTDAANGG